MNKMAIGIFLCLVFWGFQGACTLVPDVHCKTDSDCEGKLLCFVRSNQCVPQWWLDSFPQKPIELPAPDELPNTDVPGNSDQRAPESQDASEPHNEPTQPEFGPDEIAPEAAHPEASPELIAEKPPGCDSAQKPMCTYTGASITEGKGECKAGVAICEQGKWVCRGEVLPTNETCNGKDDNCDGKVDNNDCVITVAGDGSNGFQEGKALQARFSFPHCLVFDKQGNAYISDNGNHRIRKLDTSGVVSTYAGEGQPGYTDANRQTAQFNGPSWMAFDAGGNLYVLDLTSRPSGDLQPRQIDTKGMVSSLPKTPKAFLAGEGMAIDAKGHVYLSQAGQILRWNGTDWSVFAGDGFVGDTNGPALQARFNSPSHLLFDPLGNLFISDLNNGLIRMIDTQELVTTLVGGPSSSFQFQSLGGIAYNASKKTFYIMDGHQIYQMDQAKKVTLLAGTKVPGFQDGVALQAQFNSVTCLSVGLAGDLFITDTQNHRIRKLILK